MRNDTVNLRPFPLSPEKKMSRAEAERWIASQSEAVRRVTFAADDGSILQRPLIEEGAYVDPTAVLIGGMIIRPGCYIGPHAVIRLDEKASPEPFIMDEGSNLQDCAVIHSTATRIGKRVIVAHQAVVHGAAIEDDVTIYIQAVVDGSGTVIGKGSFLHQGSYVGKGIRVPEGRLVEPGRKVLVQADADRLPPVPDTLKALAEHVLEHNQSHVRKYLALAQRQ